MQLLNAISPLRDQTCLGYPALLFRLPALMGQPQPTLSLVSLTNTQCTCTDSMKVEMSVFNLRMFDFV